MSRYPLIPLAVAMLLFAAGPAFGQEQRPRNLFELLFGPPQQQQQVQPAPAPAPSRAAPPRAPAQAAAPPPPRPEVQKAADAKRVMVFGDSMAVDLARGLERFYAEDDNVRIIERGVGSSGFVREDYFNWQTALEEAIAANGFDIAVVIIGVNDRQAIGSSAPLSEAWRAAYSERVARFLSALNGAGKPVVWIELPPMERAQYGADMAQISALHRAAVQAAGGEWVETFERYMSETGGYTPTGPDLNGNITTMRKADGIHFSAAGSDKLAFYVDRAISQYHGGGGSRLEVADPLAGTDAANMLRPPFQGLGQSRLIDMASPVQQIGTQTHRANDLIVAGTPIAASQGFDIEDMLSAPAGRIDAFGVPRRDPVAVDNPSGR
ncbi:SGNH/GDSL hydrolase family protein [Pelagibacterium limicola]|uniref:SGNH/GDSL hydrolase family protein n=1 Tax=Pelagibacterium limicola TaxID=2791022 RepID=UPI0018AFF2D1|nr:DUF459 domain-containing protein [Pelagibacterium limicola]